MREAESAGVRLGRVGEREGGSGGSGGGFEGSGQEEVGGELQWRSERGNELTH